MPENELQLSGNISKMWDDIFMESRIVDASLVSVKKKFTEVRFYLNERKLIRTKRKIWMLLVQCSLSSYDYQTFGVCNNLCNVTLITIDNARPSEGFLHRHSQA